PPPPLLHTSRTSLIHVCHLPPQESCLLVAIVGIAAIYSCLTENEMPCFKRPPLHVLLLLLLLLRQESWHGKEEKASRPRVENPVSPTHKHTLREGNLYNEFKKK
ncbi:unnamed protein product, partial [Discosporangium mesarthrocarpum]